MEPFFRRAAFAALFVLAGCATEELPPPPELPLPPPPPTRVQARQAVRPRPAPPPVATPVEAPAGTIDARHDAAAETVAEAPPADHAAATPVSAPPPPAWHVARDGTLGCADADSLRVLRQSTDRLPRVMAETRTAGGCRTTFRVNEWTEVGSRDELVRLRLNSGPPLTLWFLRSDLVSP